MNENKSGPLCVSCGVCNMTVVDNSWVCECGTTISHNKKGILKTKEELLEDFDRLDSRAKAANGEQCYCGVCGPCKLTIKATRNLTEMAYDAIYPNETPEEREPRWKWVMLGITHLQDEIKELRSPNNQQLRND